MHSFQYMAIQSWCDHPIKIIHDEKMQATFDLAITKVETDGNFRSAFIPSPCICWTDPVLNLPER